MAITVTRGVIGGDFSSPLIHAFMILSCLGLCVHTMKYTPASFFSFVPLFLLVSVALFPLPVFLLSIVFSSQSLTRCSAPSANS